MNPFTPKAKVVRKVKLMRNLWTNRKPKDKVPAPTPLPDVPASSSSESFTSSLHKHTEADYSSDELESPFFPFRDKFAALITIWFANSVVSLEDYDNLLLIITDPDFNGKGLITGRKVLDKIERQLPVITPEKIIVNRKIITGKFKNSFILSKVVVWYYSPIEFTIQMMADPLCRPHLLLTKGDYSKETKVKNFNESPLFHENFLWSRLMSFQHKGIEFRVGEFVSLAQGGDDIYRLERLWYKKIRLKIFHR
jgi:hypothetical protein